MTLTTTSLRALGALSAGMLALGMLAACTPAPEPKPTKTALFASDEEAFAAAEETYQQYLATTNEIDLTDPHSFEVAFEWLGGKAETDERETLSQMHAANLTKSGTTRHRAFTPVEFATATGTIVANLCLDVSEVDLRDASGASVVPADRPDLQPLSVTFSEGNTSTGLVITESETTESFGCNASS